MPTGNWSVVGLANYKLPINLITIYFVHYLLLATVHWHYSIFNVFTLVHKTMIVLKCVVNFHDINGIFEPKKNKGEGYVPLGLTWQWIYVLSLKNAIG